MAIKIIDGEPVEVFKPTEVLNEILKVYGMTEAHKLLFIQKLYQQGEYKENLTKIVELVRAYSSYMGCIESIIKDLNYV